MGESDPASWVSCPPQACQRGHSQHLEHLLFYGAEPGAQNASGNTALHICALYNKVCSGRARPGPPPDSSLPALCPFTISLIHPCIHPSIHPFIRSLSRYLLSTFPMSGPERDAEDQAVSETDVPVTIQSVQREVPGNAGPRGEARSGLGLGPGVEVALWKMCHLC